MALLPGDDGPYVFTSKVPVLYDRSSLIDCLSRRFAYQDRETWLARIGEGAVQIDGEVRTDPDAPLRRDQKVDYVHGAYKEPEVPTDWRVLALSEDWMAVSKPSGMPMHSTSRIFRQTLAWQVRRLFGADWSPVHRLDRGTSGLVVFARGARAANALGRLFADREVSKDYLALVHGRLEDDVIVGGPIGPAGDPEAPHRQAVVDGGKPSQTGVRPLGPAPEGRGTWVVASPHQGRMHQIRVHCESIGHPLVGDLLYDGRGGESFKEKRRNAPRTEWENADGEPDLHLHAWKLRFARTGDLLLPARLECPPREGWIVPIVPE